VAGVASATPVQRWVVHTTGRKVVWMAEFGELRDGASAFSGSGQGAAADKETLPPPGSMRWAAKRGKHHQPWPETQRVSDPEGARSSTHVPARAR
jgi:hypothetical protein